VFWCSCRAARKIEGCIDGAGGGANQTAAGEIQMEMIDHQPKGGAAAGGPPQEPGYQPPVIEDEDSV
jgi:hypothetical protein